MRFLSRLVGGLFTLIVIAVGFLFWRLGQGPIPLDFLTPRLEAAAHEIDPTMEVDVGTTELVWNGDRRLFELRAEKVRLGSGDQSIAIPSVAINLETSALLRGELRLSSAELIGPSLRLVRGVNGEIALGVEGEGGAGLALPADAPQRRLPIDELGVRDGDLVVDDRASGQTWTLDHFDLLLRPDATGFGGEVRADVDLSPLLGAAPADAPTSRIAKVSAKGSYDRGADRLDLREIGVDLADAAVRGSGEVASLRGASPQIGATVKLAKFAVDALPRYWPATAATSARAWVTGNITGGQVKDAEVRLTATAGQGASLGKLDGSMSFEGLSVRYLDTMSPVTAVNGTATLSATSADFTVTSAKVEDVAVRRATVKLPIGGAPRIAIDAEVEGPVTTVARVLNKPPVELDKLVAGTPRAGTVSGRLGLAFPLRSALRFADLGLTVSADASGIAADRIIGDLGAEDASLNLSLRGPDLVLTSKGRLGGVPAWLDLRDRIGTRGARQIAVKAEIDAAGWKTLGVETGGLVNGTTAVNAKVLEEGNGIVLDAGADLQRASLDLPIPLPDKREDVPGRAGARIRFVGGELVAIDAFSLTFTGNSLVGAAARTRTGWSTVRAEGTFAPPSAGGVAGRMKLDVAADGSFRLTTADLGTLLRTLGYDNGQRGNLTFQGTVSLNEPRLPFSGRAALVDFTLKKSPVLARVLTLSSVRGLTSAFMQTGIKFDRTSAQLTHHEGILTIQDGVARADSVTVMVNGWMDPGGDRLELSGRVIPSYFGINQGIAKIPVLGGLLTGKEAGAVQAIDFTAKGTFGDPQVSVNPLTSLTPQVLQDLWKKVEW